MMSRRLLKSGWPDWAPVGAGQLVRVWGVTIGSSEQFAWTSLIILDRDRWPEDLNRRREARIHKLLKPGGPLLRRQIVIAGTVTDPLTEAVFGGHGPSLSVYGPRKSESSARVFYRQANSEERDEVTHD